VERLMMTMPKVLVLVLVAVLLALAVLGKG
jgi:hypothetical protein